MVVATLLGGGTRRGDSGSRWASVTRPDVREVSDVTSGLPINVLGMGRASPANTLFYGGDTLLFKLSESEFLVSML